MPGYLLQHVVEESQASMNVGLSATVKVETNRDICLIGLALHLSKAFSGKSYLGYASPIVVIGYDERVAPQITGKLGIAIPVTYHKTVFEVVFPIHILSEHSRTRLASRQIIGWETAVNMDGLEFNAFALQYIEHEIVGRPERILRIGIGAKSILVTDHDKDKISVLPKKAQSTDDSGHEAELIKTVNLLVLRLAQDGSVTVNE